MYLRIILTFFRLSDDNTHTFPSPIEDRTSDYSPSVLSETNFTQHENFPNEQSEWSSNDNPDVQNELNQSDDMNVDENSENVLDNWDSELDDILADDNELEEESSDEEGIINIYFYSLIEIKLFYFRRK